MPEERCRVLRRRLARRQHRLRSMPSELPAGSRRGRRGRRRRGSCPGRTGKLTLGPELARSRCSINRSEDPLCLTAVLHEPMRAGGPTTDRETYDPAGT
jgi:hypothetical protein